MYSLHSVIVLVVIAAQFSVSRSIGPTRQQRQPCTQATECYPVGFSAGGVEVPNWLINCTTDGECACNECFRRNANSGRCAVDAPCWDYSTQDAECDDNRRSQLIAFVLSAALSSTGAANFYIARYEFAVPQLAILVLFILAGCFGRILYQARSNKSTTQSLCLWISVIVSLVLGIIAILTIASWWLADLVIFIRNTRRDGDGCTLRGNL